MQTGARLPQRRTPLEQAAFEQTRRGRYEKAMKEQGFAKCSWWVPVDCRDDLGQLIKLLGSTNGDIRRKLADLVK